VRENAARSHLYHGGPGERIENRPRVGRRSRYRHAAGVAIGAVVSKVIDRGDELGSPNRRKPLAPQRGNKSVVCGPFPTLSIIFKISVEMLVMLAPVRSPRSAVAAERRSLDVAGQRRSFMAIRGRVGIATPAPLVVILHGTMQTGRSVRAFAGFSFDRYAANGTAYVVYPDALRRDWNGARKAVMVSQKTKNVDDVGFIRSLVAHMVDNGADARRVYVVGFSLGGQMVIRLIHEIPELFAGAAIIGSNLPAPGNFNIDCDARGQLPVLTMHGTADPLAPFDGGRVTIHGHLPRGRHLSAAATAAYFAARNGITSPPTAVRLPHVGDFGKPTNVTRYEYRANGAAPVRFYAIDGGGHVIPNPRRQPSEWFMGPTTGDLVAADAIAEFFGLSRCPVPD
jgi:polyhydroxybutyrate depolymerase